MANRRRGDVDAIFDDQTFTLRLTLGALAELEDAFGASDLIGLAARFEDGRLSARDIMRIIGSGIRGGGAQVSDDDVARFACDGGLDAYINVAAQLLSATFGELNPEVAPTGPSAPQDA
ncbi:MAG: gene transfer agent family protein [Beijerinckiaceae bacterium]|nr:gene transfer agent family protein [Beijerinckiaceae bacterium]